MKKGMLFVFMLGLFITVSYSGILFGNISDATFPKGFGIFCLCGMLTGYTLICFSLYEKEKSRLTGKRRNK